MRILTRPLVWCIALAACSVDSTQPTPPPGQLNPSPQVSAAAATWNRVDLASDAEYVAINNRYQLIGYSVDESGALRQFIQRLGQQQRRYLGADFVANALNDFGVLAGSYKGAPAFWDSQQRVTMIPGLVRGSAIDISETGWIIGSGQLIDGRTRSFVWRPGWAAIRILAAGNASATPVSVVSVNNSGYSVGTVGGRGGVFSPSGEFTPIPLPDSVDFVEPAEINDAGQVVGHAQVFHPFGTHSGFVWSESNPLTVMVPVHLFLQFYVTDVDRLGRVYGTVRTDAVFHSPGVWIGGARLPQYLGSAYGHLADVNDCGVIVAWEQYPPETGLPKTPFVLLTECQ